MTALWRNCRAWSAGVRGIELAVCASAALAVFEIPLDAAAGRDAVTVGGSGAAGARAAKASCGVGVDVSCPPNERLVADCEFCIAICR